MTTGFIDLPTRLKISSAQWSKQAQQLLCELRVAMPAVVVSFDPVKQTVVVQPAIRENLLVNSTTTPVDIPELQDVPVVMMRAGGVALTMPIQPGDECLVVFADMCIDAWYQSGGTQNVQMDKRRHDLSDAIAIFGIWSQPNTLDGYSQSAAQLRDESGDSYLEVMPGQVNVAQNLTVENGASGSFTTQGGQVITVVNGIIVSIT